jgi:dienelactone hydrolase
VPLPAVIVHPEAGYRAADMRGVLNDLAEAGYLAVAADYQRRKGNRWRQSLFPWQDPADPMRAIDRVRAHPGVDPQRIGLLGFSQGGVLSLLIAAYDGGAAAVVAYYPVTDFEGWLEAAGAGPGRRLVFRLIRIGFRRASGAHSDADLQVLLRRASPLWQARSIRAPVLLVHGDRDGSAGIEESRRLAQRLSELKRPVKLLVIHGGGHVFNFRDRRQAGLAWQATLNFLDRHLQSTGRHLLPSPPRGQLPPRTSRRIRPTRQSGFAVKLDFVLLGRGRVRAGDLPLCVPLPSDGSSGRAASKERKGISATTFRHAGANRKVSPDLPLARGRSRHRAQRSRPWLRL